MRFESSKNRLIGSVSGAGYTKVISVVAERIDRQRTVHAG